MYWSSSQDYQKSFRKMQISAKAVVTTRGGKILLLRKTNGLFDFPGGKVEKGEGWADALKREIAEETSLKLTRFKFVASWIKHSPGYAPRLMIVFKAPVKERASALAVDLSNEHDWYKFISPDKALKMPMEPGYKTAIATIGQKRICV